MNREHLQDDLIELGTATEETKGIAVGFLDQEGGQRPITGLTDD